MQPFVGMTVQYYPGSGDRIVKHDDQPLAAIVSAVYSDACANLAVFDVNGHSNSIPSVTLYPRSALKEGCEPGCVKDIIALCKAAGVE